MHQQSRKDLGPGLTLTDLWKIIYHLNSLVGLGQGAHEEN